MTAASEKILFIPPKTVSGAAMSLAAAREVRRVHRKAKIVCLAAPAVAPLFEASPYFNTVDPDGDPQDWKQASLVIKKLKGTGFDAVYDFRGSQLTQRMQSGMRPRPAIWSSPAQAEPDEADELVGAVHPMERIERQLVAAGVLEAPTGLLPDLSWLSAVGRNTRTLEPAYFGLTDHYAVLLPCAAAREKAPVTFKPEEWAALAAALLEQGLRPVVLGSVNDRAVANAVRAATPQAKEFLGRTNLLQLASLSRSARIVVSAVAPAAHLAAAAAADLITVFAAGDPDPRAAAPRGEGSVIALTPSSARVSIGDVMQSARALGAFRRNQARVGA